MGGGGQGGAGWLRAGRKGGGGGGGGGTWGSWVERRYLVMVASYNILYGDEARDYYFRHFMRTVRDKKDKGRTVWVARGWGEIEGLCGEKLRG